MIVVGLVVVLGSRLREYWFLQISKDLNVLIGLSRKVLLLT